MTDNPDILTDRFERALSYAHVVHGGHCRKGTKIPYISHLLAVASLVLEDGGDEDEAIAALLHDAVEDRGGVERLEDIRARFGKHVADIVESCSDTDIEPKPAWRERKEAYLAHLRKADSSTLRVSAADKLHNLPCILSDWDSIGEKLWERFRAGKKDQLWYYSELGKIFQMRKPDGFVTRELGTLLNALRESVDGRA